MNMEQNIISDVQATAEGGTLIGAVLAVVILAFLVYKIWKKE